MSDLYPIEIYINHHVLQEGILSDVLDKIKSKTNNIIKNYLSFNKIIENKLEKENIPIKEIKKVAKYEAIKFSKTIKDKNIKNIKTVDKKDSENLEKNINNTVHKCMKLIGKVTISTLITLVIAIIHTYLIFFLGSITGEILIGSYLVGAFVAPFLEEFFKRFSIKYNFGEIYIKVFSWIEYILYVIPYYAATPLFFTMLIGRLLPVWMHHKWFNLQKNIDWKDRKDDKIKTSGYWTAVILHMINNAVPLYGTIFNVMILKGDPSAQKKVSNEEK